MLPSAAAFEGVERGDGRLASSHARHVRHDSPVAAGPHSTMRVGGVM